MPLIKSTSKKAFSSNVRAEVAAKKPVKQAVAIAYSEKRQAEKKRHLWRGGKVEKTPGIPTQMIHRLVSSKFGGSLK